jgi:Uma2 family endonuclease
MTVFTIDLSSITSISDEQFDDLCVANPEVKLERTSTGELVIMSPTGGETGKRNVELAADFVYWNRSTQLGVVFDSSTCFRLPGGGDRSPDVAWVEKSRWDGLTPEQQRKFPPICPDFVLELLSPTDNITTTRKKMQEYRSSGIRLGWLIDAEQKQVEIYRPGQAIEVLLAPTELSGESVLPGFTLKLDLLWQS